VRGRRRGLELRRRRRGLEPHEQPEAERLPPSDFDDLRVELRGAWCDVHSEQRDDQHVAAVHRHDDRRHRLLRGLLHHSLHQRGRTVRDVVRLRRVDHSG
jgi:hypothetical protein